MSDIVGTPGDAGLLAVAQSLNSDIEETADAAVLTFNFVPAGDTVKFNFVFASDEYTDFSCTQWNDIFGFFVTGANPAGGNYNNTNLAVVPGTNTPITINICGDTIVTTGTIYIIDEPNISILENDPVALCADDSILMSAVASGGGAPYTYAWSNGQTGSSAYGAVSINGPTNYYVTATDFCSFTKTDTVTITLNQTLAIDSMLQYPATACTPTGTVAGFASGFSGIPSYNWAGPGANSQNEIDASVFQQLSPRWYYFTISDNVCLIKDSILLTQDQAPVASFTASTTSGCSSLTVNFTNNSQNASEFQWNFGNGSLASGSNTNNQSEVYTSNATVQLIAIEAGCSDTMTMEISIVFCGCTDPSVQIDNGNCFYPVPLVEVPNVFTPDGDNVNELFLLNTTNAINVEMTIYNRWGNIMYHGSGLNPTWDGKSDGVIAQEGTYFVKYIVSGYNNQKTEGNGFIQLINNKI